MGYLNFSIFGLGISHRDLDYNGHFVFILYSFKIDKLK